MDPGNTLECIPMDLISCQGAIDIALDEQESIPVKVQNHQTDPTSLFPLDLVNLHRSQAFQEKIPFFIFSNFPNQSCWKPHTRQGNDRIGRRAASAF